MNRGYVRDRKVNSFRQVIELKSGYLLIMLHDGKSKAERLRKLGMTNLADSVEQWQKNKSLSIISSFRKNFNFCPVYFFESSEAEKLLEHGIDSITILNDDLSVSSQRPPSGQKFLVAEFDRLQNERPKYWGGYHLSTQDTGEWRKPWYYSTSTFLYQAYIIQTPQLVQLQRPFKNFIIITETKKKIYFLDSVARKSSRRLERSLIRARYSIQGPRFKRYFADLNSLTN